MIELPEAFNISHQIKNTITGKRISSVDSEHTPHKLAWYYGDRAKYSDILVGRIIEDSKPFGGLVEITAGETKILLGEGVNIRFHNTGEPRPAKHQFLIEFDDGSALSAAVQMYGGMGAFPEGGLNNPYYLLAKEKPSPLTDAFNRDYFHQVTSSPHVQKLSLKALLATEQRIPGLGNGVLQDILFNSKMHPKKKVNTLNMKDFDTLFENVRGTLARMANEGGRDIESDLFGRQGGYRTILSKNKVDRPCPVCRTPIEKEAYLGGSIYYCRKCQII